jgi:hypothetical protein
LRSLRYLRLKTLLTAVGADGQSARGAPSDTGGEARQIEPQKNANNANAFVPIDRLSCFDFE